LRWGALFANLNDQLILVDSNDPPSAGQGFAYRDAMPAPIVIAQETNGCITADRAVKLPMAELRNLTAI